MPSKQNPMDSGKEMLWTCTRPGSGSRTRTRTRTSTRTSTRTGLPIDPI